MTIAALFHRLDRVIRRLRADPACGPATRRAALRALAAVVDRLQGDVPPGLKAFEPAVRQAQDDLRSESPIHHLTACTSIKTLAARAFDAAFAA